MLGNGYCQTLSKINYLELSLCESKLKYPKLISKNYLSSFECSKYQKLTKSDPKITKSSLLMKIKTSSAQPPYYSTEHRRYALRVNMLYESFEMV